MKKLLSLIFIIGLCIFGLCGCQNSNVTYKDPTTGEEKELEIEKTTDEVEVAFFGLDKQPFKDINGVDTLIDTLWIYFKDGTFEQYANIGDEIVLFSTGTFETKIGKDYFFNLGDILTINRENKYKAGIGLDNNHNSTHDYEIDKIGFTKVNISLRN